MIKQGIHAEGEGSVRTTSLNRLLFIRKKYISLLEKTSYLNKEVNCTEPFPSVKVPWIKNLTKNDKVSMIRLS
jgi:hypothetical protein